MIEDKYFLGDNPIKSIDEDLFNFEHYALKVQKLIQHNSNNPNPMTIGIYGKWGEGKTSFLSLIENKVDIWRKENKTDKGILKYHFNPWRYSTKDEMLFDFFDGLANLMYVQKNSSLQKVGKGVLRVSKYLKAVKLSASVGLSDVNKLSATVDVGEIFKALGEDLKGEELTIDNLKDKVNSALKESRYKVLVFIDDLDRLDKDEIYAILKLIKLNGNFENFIYLVTLDFEQVSKAISGRYGDNIEDGKFFIEKIINIPIHLPRIEDVDLKNFFVKKTEELQGNLPFLDKQKKDIEFQEIINSFAPEFFKSPREVIRVFNSFFIGAFSIGEEVNLHDLFWIEYLKIKYFRTYEAVKYYSFKNSITISFQDTLDFNDEFQADKKPNGKRLELFNLDEESYHIIEKLFPVESKLGTVFARSFDKEKMKSELRINTVDNFDKYFSYHTIRKISSLDIFKLEKAISDENKEEVTRVIKRLVVQAGSESHRVSYVLEELTKNLIVEKEIRFWYKFAFSNLELIPEGGKAFSRLDNESSLIELIAEILNNSRFSNNDVESSDFILELANKLSKDQLCHFTRKFDEGKVFKGDLEKLVISKLKEEDYLKTPFFLNPQLFSNRFVMYYWKKHNPKEFENYLDKTIDSKEMLGLLIRGFVSFWNNAFYGSMDVEGYKNIQRLLFKNLVYSKVCLYAKNLAENFMVDNASFHNHEEYSVDENIEQFIFHYTNDKANLNS